MTPFKNKIKEKIRWTVPVHGGYNMYYDIILLW